MLTMDLRFHHTAVLTDLPELEDCIDQLDIVDQEFVRAYFQEVDEDEIYDRTPEELLSMALHHRTLVQQCTGEGVCLRVFDPTLIKDGWESRHTHIQLVMPDAPYLMDSIELTLKRLGLVVHLLLAPNIHSVDLSGDLSLRFVHIAIDRMESEHARGALQEEMARVIHELGTVLADQEAIHHLLSDQITERLAPQDPVARFLAWLDDQHFVFLGAACYEHPSALPSIGTALGIAHTSPQFAALPSDRGQSDDQLIITQSSERAHLVRTGYPDIIIIRLPDAPEWRFVGFFTNAGQAEPVHDIPFLREKLELTLLLASRQGAREPQRILEPLLSLPRDELLEGTPEELANTAIGLLKLRNQQRLKLFIREDRFNRYITCLAYVARDLYDTTMMDRMQSILRQNLGGVGVEVDLTFGEASHARLLFRVWLAEGSQPQYQVEELEAALSGATRRWADELRTNLLMSEEESRAITLHRRYAALFSADYCSAIPARLAIADIRLLEALHLGPAFALSLEQRVEHGQLGWRLAMASQRKPIPLSRSLAMLSRFGLTIDTERTYHFTAGDSQEYWICDFGFRAQALNPEQRDNLLQAIESTLERFNEDDPFNQLTLRANLPIREVSLIRALSRYLRQAGFGFTETYQAEALAHHPDLTHKLIKLFRLRLKSEGVSDMTLTLLSELMNQLEHLAATDAARMLRTYANLILAITRCNYFQTDDQGQPKPWLSFKFDPNQLALLQRTNHHAEFFVYAPEVEGVLLISENMARGRLVATQRQEDYRNAALEGLAQQTTENLLIGPGSAYGCFVTKRRLPELAGQAIFLNGLFDLLDNRVDQEWVAPPGTRCYDQTDPYLALHFVNTEAADAANQQARFRHYWLGEGFASPGSNSFLQPQGHVEAQAMWQALQEHQYMLGRDIAHSPLRVIIIGKPSDPRIAGLLRQSPQWTVVGAVDDHHILLDDGGAAIASHAERLMLIEKENAGWGQFNTLETGTSVTVWPRTSPNLALPKSMQGIIDTNAEEISGDALVQTLLRAPVDCLIFADDGDWIKAEHESNQQLTDRQHDSVRVDASTVRSAVITEYLPGALTKAARVEYATRGGRIFSAAFDNAALLDLAERETQIRLALANSDDPRLNTEEGLHVELALHRAEAMSDALVSQARQLRFLSTTTQAGPEMISLQNRYIHWLEQHAGLDRQRYALPSDEEITERRASHKGLTEPEVATLFTFGKQQLYHALLKSDLPDELEYSLLITDYFPAELSRRHSDALADHPMRREVIASVLSQHIISQMGPSFLYRVTEEVKAQPAAVARAWLVACEVFDANSFWEELRSLNYVLPAHADIQMNRGFHKLLERATRWLLRNYPQMRESRELVRKFGSRMAELKHAMLDRMQGADYIELELAEHKLVRDGVPPEMARWMSRCEQMIAALDIMEVAHTRQTDPSAVANVYLDIGKRLQLDWLLQAINRLPRDNHWQTLARASLRDELYRQYRALTAVVLQTYRAPMQPEQCLDDWMRRRHPSVAAWLQSLSLLMNQRHVDLAMLTAASRELRHHLLS